MQFWYTSKLRLTGSSINFITGRIPTELGRCSAVTQLYLQVNKLTGTHVLCSKCPAWYTSKLSAHKRSIKYFIGRIPTELGRCSAMDELDLSYNKLTGTCVLCSRCPAWYTSLPSCFVRKNALVSTRAACMCVHCELTIRHASRLRSRCTGQDAFKTFMKQTVPACRLDL